MYLLIYFFFWKCKLANFIFCMCRIALKSSASVVVFLLRDLTDYLFLKFDLFNLVQGVHCPWELCGEHDRQELEFSYLFCILWNEGRENIKKNIILGTKVIWMIEWLELYCLICFIHSFTFKSPKDRGYISGKIVLIVKQCHFWGILWRLWKEKKERNTVTFLLKTKS